MRRLLSPAPISASYLSPWASHYGLYLFLRLEKSFRAPNSFAELGLHVLPMPPLTEAFPHLRGVLKGAKHISAVEATCGELGRPTSLPNQPQLSSYVPFLYFITKNHLHFAPHPGFSPPLQPLHPALVAPLSIPAPYRGQSCPSSLRG